MQGHSFYLYHSYYIGRILGLRAHSISVVSASNCIDKFVTFRPTYVIIALMSLYFLAVNKRYIQVGLYCIQKNKIKAMTYFERNIKFK